MAEKTLMPDWLRRLKVAVRLVIPKDFVGQITINCFKGGISTISLDQTWKADEDDE